MVDGMMMMVVGCVAKVVVVEVIVVISVGR